MWDEPVIARGLRRSGARHRVITCDLVGVGSSDPVFFGEHAGDAGLGRRHRRGARRRGERAAPHLREWRSRACRSCCIAASHPERVQSLVLWAPFARYERATTTRSACRRKRSTRILDVASGRWSAQGDRRAARALARATTHDSASGGRAVNASRRGRGVLRTHLRTIPPHRCPARRSRASRRRPSWCAGSTTGTCATVTPRRSSNTFPTRASSRCPGQRPRRGSQATPTAGSTQVEEFLTGERVVRADEPRPGDGAVHRHRRIHRAGGRGRRRGVDDRARGAQRARSSGSQSFRGEVISFTGDGVLAVFDGPARAIECAERDHAMRSATSGSRSAPGSTPAKSR